MCTCYMVLGKVYQGGNILIFIEAQTSKDGIIIIQKIDFFVILRLNFEKLMVSETLHNRGRT